jgi:hypothetical protein
VPAARLRAVYPEKYPLRNLLSDAKFVVEAKVARADAEKKRLVVEVARDLKGKLPFRRLNVNLAAGEGTAKPEDAKKQDEPDQVLRRVKDGTPLVVFGFRDEKGFKFLAFTEGTWFSVESRTPPPAKGEPQAADPPPAAVCGFDACWPKLRRTYAGSTKDFLALLAEVIAGKREAPPVNDKEPPGLGPELPRTTA